MKSFLKLTVLSGVAVLLFSCQKDDIKNEYKVPVVTFEDCALIAPEGGNVTVGFSVVNPVEDGIAQAAARSSETWAHDFTVSDGVLSFVADAYEATREEQQDRTAVITFEYPEAEDVTFTVTQAAPEQILAPEVVFETPEAVAPEGGNVSVGFSVSNPVEDGIGQATARSSEAWAHDFSVSDGTLSFVVDAYEATAEEQQDRTTVITFEYPEAEAVSFTLVQTAPDPAVADELTFTLELVNDEFMSKTIRCTPSDPDATYVFEYKSQYEYDETYADDFAKLVADDIAYFTEDTGFGPGTIEENLCSGVQEKTFQTMSNSYAIVYGLNADGTVTTSKATLLAFSGF